MPRTNGNSKMEDITFRNREPIIIITEKVCAACGEKKNIHRFSIKPSMKDGRWKNCLDCDNKKYKPAIERKKKEKDFWAQFSPI